eukprot:Lankesteria_metandrocarpae@DN5483_c0_g1_i20.p1
MTVTYFGVMCVLQVVGSCSAVRHGNLNVPRDGIMPMMENETSVSDEMFNENYFPSTETSVLTELGQLLLDGIMPMMENETSVSDEMFNENYFPSTETSVLTELRQLFLDGIMPMMENETSVSEEMFDGKYFPDSHRSPRRRSTLPVATNGLPVGINEAHVNYMDSHRSRSRSPRRGPVSPTATNPPVKAFASHRVGSIDILGGPVNLQRNYEQQGKPYGSAMFVDTTPDTAANSMSIPSVVTPSPDDNVVSEVVMDAGATIPSHGRCHASTPNRDPTADTLYNRSPSRCRQEVTGSTGKIKKVPGCPDGENKSEVARAMLSHACGKEYPDGCTQGHHIYTCIGPHSRNAVVHEYDTRFAVTPQEYTSTQYFEYRHFGKPNAKTLAYLAACYAANRDDRKPVTGREIKIRVDNTGGNLLYRYRPNKGKCYGFSRHSFGEMGAWVLVHKTKWFRLIAQTPADWLVNTQG